MTRTLLYPSVIFFSITCTAIRSRETTAIGNKLMIIPQSHLNVLVASEQWELADAATTAVHNNKVIAIIISGKQN